MPVSQHSGDWIEAMGETPSAHAVTASFACAWLPHAAQPGRGERQKSSILDSVGQARSIHSATHGGLALCTVRGALMTDEMRSCGSGAGKLPRVQISRSSCCERF